MADSRAFADAAGGELYTDGSSFPSVFCGLARARWSVVSLSLDGRPNARAFGTMPASFSHTSAGSEWCALRRAFELGGNQATLLSDYLAGVNAVATGTWRQRATSRTPCAGVLRPLLAQIPAGVRNERKVKAHAQ